jgi:predicted SAM-dependent methyltransferase
MKLHLGCGERFISCFFHIDIIEGEHIDYQHDVRTLPMFDDETVDLIYASHVLEYFDWVEVIDVLREWWRVLKVGGTLRLAVPSLEALIRLYDEHGLASVLGPLYGRMETDHKTIYHRVVYDHSSLALVLRLTGFKGIRRWDWRLTEHADVDDCSQSYYPHMDKDNGLLLSLNVEATK